MKADYVGAQSGSGCSPYRQSTTELLQILIDRVTACERVFDLGKVSGPQRGEIVFVDDLENQMQRDAIAAPDRAADPAELVARYAAILRSAVDVLEQIRNVQAAGKTAEPTLPAFDAVAAEPRRKTG